jgi:hypothetical protein
MNGGMSQAKAERAVVGDAERRRFGCYGNRRRRGRQPRWGGAVSNDGLGGTASSHRALHTKVAWSCGADEAALDRAGQPQRGGRSATIVPESFILPV